MRTGKIKTKAKQILFSVMRISTVVLIISLIGLHIIEYKLIFEPVKELSGSPSKYGIKFEDVYFRASDGAMLHGWYIPFKNSKSVVLYFHGNAQNISNCLDYITRLSSFVGTDVFIIDYHGYGKSEGRPSEKNLYMDGRAALEELRRRLGDSNKKVIVFGRSLGGAVAVDVAAGEKCDGLILESTFTSMPELAKDMFPFLPSKKLVWSKFDSLSKIGGIRVPKMIIHGEQDDLIPISHGRRLFKEAMEPKEFYPVPGAGHNDTNLISEKEYFRRVGDFIHGVENTSSEIPDISPHKLSGYKQDTHFYQQTI